MDELVVLFDHFVDGTGADLPDALHAEGHGVGGAIRGESIKAFVGDMKAIGDIDGFGSLADEGSEGKQHVVGD